MTSAKEDEGSKGGTPGGDHGGGGVFPAESAHAARNLCFNPEDLRSQPFDAAPFVRKCTERVSLETLRADLDSHTQTLSASLVDLVRSEYATFASVGPGLRGVDTSAREILRVAEEASKTAEASVKGVPQLLHQVETLLAHKADVAAARGALEVCLEFDMGLRKVELLMGGEGGEGGEAEGEPAADPAGSGPAAASMPATTLVTIERAAAELYQLHFLMRRGAGGPAEPFLKARVPRMRDSEAQLGTLLRSRFEDAVAQRDVTAATQCLRAYAAIDRVADAEQLFGRAAVAPAVREAVARSADAARPDGAARGADASRHLPAVFRAAVGAAREASLWIHECDGLSMVGFRVASHAVWPALIDATLEAAGRAQLFSPADAGRFRAAYDAAVAFLADVESSLCGTDSAAIAALRAHPDHIGFVEKWRVNLPVYFGLCAREIAASVDAAIGDAGAVPARCTDTSSSSPPASSAPPSSPPGFLLAAFQGAWCAYQRCHDPSVHVGALADRFATLALQIGTRISEWVAVGLGSVGSGNGPWVKGLSTEGLFALHHDLLALARELRGGVAELAASRVPGPAGDRTDAARGALRAALGSQADGIDLLAARASDLVVSAIAKKPCEALHAMRSLTATFRLLNKETPSKPSIYVGNVIKPIAEDLAAARDVADGEACRAWGERAVGTIAETFADLAKELIDNMRQTESSLRRLKASQGAGQQSKSLNSDKIFLQMSLDVDEFARLCREELGIEVKSLEAFQRLKSTVRGQAAAE